MSTASSVSQATCRVTFGASKLAKSPRASGARPIAMLSRNSGPCGLMRMRVCGSKLAIFLPSSSSASTVGSTSRAMSPPTSGRSTGGCGTTQPNSKATAGLLLPYEFCQANSQQIQTSHDRSQDNRRNRVCPGSDDHGSDEDDEYGIAELLYQPCRIDDAELAQKQQHQRQLKADAEDQHDDADEADPFVGLDDGLQVGRRKAQQEVCCKRQDAPAGIGTGKEQHEP